MALDTLYSIGTISVGAGSTTVTGVGTAWITSDTRPGDDFRAAGLVVPIASIDSATQITLARPWPGAAIAAGNYDIRQIDDGARALTAANIMRQSLGSGTLTSLAALTSGTNLMPYWSGVGVMATTPLSAAARTLLAGASAAAMRDVLGVGTPEDYAAAEDIERIENGLTLAALTASKAETAVDVLVYDTSRDSDGGAWRKRCQHTSWWNETLNTATRGARREFPAVAVIVAEAAKVTIYDGDDPALPMWMVFNELGDVGTASGILPSAGAKSCIAMLNGSLSVGDSQDGLILINFLMDNARNYRLITSSYTGAYFTGSVANRNSVGFSYLGDYADGAIVGQAVNDVAMAVLPGAPTDPVTGLPVPTIAVATGGGVSVIKDDGSVVDIAYSTYSVTARVAFRSDGALVFSTGAALNDQRWIHVFRRIPSVDILDPNGFAKGSSDEHYTGPYNAAYSLDLQWPGVSGNSATCLLPGSWGGEKGLVRLAPNPAAPSKGMLAAITASHNTGWMVGATKGAFLASTDSAPLVGSGELVTNGTFDTDLSGWTAATPETVLTHNAGRIRVAGTAAGAYGKAAATIPTVIGKTYVLQLEGFAGTGSPNVYLGSSAGASNYAAFTPSAGPITFVALTATTHITLFSSAALGVFYSEYDNVSVRLAEPDRSAGARGMIAHGTLTRTAVATGAQLMGYSGWSAANYLEQAYNPALDFGTGDFFIGGWFQLSGAGGYVFDRTDVADAGARVRVYVTSTVVQLVTEGRTINVATTAYASGWHFYVGFRSSGVDYLFVDGVLIGSGSDTANLSNAAAFSRLGTSYAGSTPFAGTLALWRIGATAPTAEQIRQIYEDEKALFQPGAQCTLYGASDAVTALAEDPVTGLLHVGTSAGRSDFQGLRRIANTTTAVTTAISAAGGLIAEQ
ncbi:LamG-like jellyroll fold domain-containing protein [Pararhodobacter aggregans]|uniref:LamG-like jellyroll fold domain-containing protein n=1 Tax=Pararhodobacter aggregans TaxID=404875 RepID=UPI003A8D6E26